MIFIASDHRGFIIKQKLIKYFNKESIKYINGGTNDSSRVDAYLFAKTATDAIILKKADLGILICGTGIAMSMCANRVKGIRAVQMDNKKLAIRAKEHNNANVLCFGSEIVSFRQAKRYLKAFLKAKFLGGIYEERNKQLDNI